MRQLITEKTDYLLSKEFNAMVLDNSIRRLRCMLLQHDDMPREIIENELELLKKRVDYYLTTFVSP